jgi:anti-anti-sigma regulatory factor
MTITVEVAPSITVRSAGVFRQALLDGLEADDQIDLDLAEVTDVDLSFIQMLHAARETARRSGKAVRLCQPASGAVVALLDRAGFLTAPTPDDLDFWFHGERPQ